jgi:prophage regulatory protein
MGRGTLLCPPAMSNQSPTSIAHVPGLNLCHPKTSRRQQNRAQINSTRPGRAGNPCHRSTAHVLQTRNTGLRNQMLRPPAPRVQPLMQVKLRVPWRTRAKYSSTFIPTDQTGDRHMTRNQTVGHPSSIVADDRSAPSPEADSTTARASSSAAYHSETRLLRLAEVIRRTGLGKTKIYELQKAGMCPSSVHVTSTAVRWIDSEVEGWLLAQVSARSSRCGSPSRQR